MRGPMFFFFLLLLLLLLLLLPSPSYTLPLSLSFFVPYMIVLLSPLAITSLDS